MTKRTTWSDGELRELYRIYRCVAIVHVHWSRASKKPKWHRWLRVTGEKVMDIQSRQGEENVG